MVGKRGPILATWVTMQNTCPSTPTDAFLCRTYCCDPRKDLYRQRGVRSGNSCGLAFTQWVEYGFTIVVDYSYYVRLSCSAIAIIVNNDSDWNNDSVAALP